MLAKSQGKRLRAVSSTPIGDLLAGLDAAERLDVGVGLLLDDVDDVVDHQRSDEAVTLVDNGRRDEVVALEHARHLLLRLGRLDPVGIVDHDLRHHDGALRPQQLVERHRAEEAHARVDDEDLVEGLGQVGRLAHVVDRLPDRPERRHGDELGLHQPTGRVLRIVERALQGDALGRRQLVEDLGLVLLVEALEDRDGVVRVEVAHALGDGRRLELLEDFLADRLVDLGQGGEIEIAAEELDEARAVLGLERLEHVAEIGLVQVFGERPHALAVADLDRGRERRHEARVDVLVLVPHRRDARGVVRLERRLVLDVRHGPRP